MYITNLRTGNAAPLKHSTFFNRPKHSENWHQTIDSIAGVLHPADAKFPYPLLRQATDTYIKKKGKITQADIDVRLAALIESHAKKDIAVAAVAHAITAGSLRALLSVDLNVAHGNYWGLDVWLQCLITANHENLASVTDMEATWAQHLLPFATYGPGAAGKVLIGVSRALRESAPTPNMNMVPDFLRLTVRAVTDHAAHLEGLRLKNNWIAAHGASYWMAELNRASAPWIPPGYMFLEHIFDTRFPEWRAWANWRPNVGLAQIMSSVDSSSAAMLSDLLALEGPDFISGTGDTLREGLVGRYDSDRTFIKFGGLLVELHNRTKEGLMEVLESAISTLVSILTTASSSDRPLLLRFFISATISRPMTQESLNLVQAVLFMTGGTKSSLGSDRMDSVLHVYTNRETLDGSDIRELQHLIQIFDRDNSSNFRKILLTPALLQGIAKCINDGQTAASTLIDQGQPWIELVLELHRFCTVFKESKSVPIVGNQTIEKMCLLLPPVEHVTVAIDVWTAAHNQRTLDRCAPTDANSSTKSVKATDNIPGSTTGPSLSTTRGGHPLHSLEEVVEHYISHRILLQQPPDCISQRTFESVLRVWQDAFAPDCTQNRRSLAILVADITSDNVQLRLRCLNGIASTKDQLCPGLSVQALLIVLESMEKNPEHGMVKFIELLARCPVAHDSKTQVLCWRDLAYYMLAQEGQSGICKDMKLLNHILSTMNASEWLSFLAETQMVFISGPYMPLEEDVIPPVLQSSLQEHWALLMPYTKTLTRLEETLGDKSEAMRCILGCRRAQSSNVMLILQILKDVEQEPIELFLHTIISSLNRVTDNAWEVSQCVSIISDASSETVEICKKIWDAKHGYLMMPQLPNRDLPNTDGDDGLKMVTTLTLNAAKTSASLISAPALANKFASRYDVPSPVVEVMVIGWLLDEKASEDTKTAVRAIACLLMIAHTSSDLTKDKLMVAAAFWQRLEDELIKEATRLDALQKALKKKDPHGTSLLLQQHGIPDTTELDEEISGLPADIVDVVERIGDNEVEMTFSLGALTLLKRAAMGIPEGANTISLQLFLDRTKKSPSEFCLHYNTDLHVETLVHTRYNCSDVSENPTGQICTSPQTAFTWQLSRIIYSKLRRGETGILDLHRHVTASLPDLTQYCVSCSTAHEAKTSRLRRSIPCDSNLYACAELWYALPLHVRIPEIRTDTFAVDIALSSVYSAAVTHKSELLQGCPMRTFSSVRTIINSLPTLAVMRDAVNLSAVLSSYHPDAEKLISWVVVQHRGFLASATGLLKIPILPPGTHQFVLANANPKLESTFAQRLQATKRDTTVLFHGTSLDRLPAILTQGLRIYSGTALQRTGAAHGRGIYLSEDPTTSFSYSTASLSWKNSGLNMMRMMLGCELVGTANKVVGNVHVVTDVESVMVRYVLLFPRDARMPIRGHIEPAMASGMKALRSGAT